MGTIEGGVRNNIIPETTKMVGTVRTLDTTMQRQIHEHIRRVATSTAEGMGATVDIEIDRGYPVTKNDPALTAALKPTTSGARDTQIEKPNVALQRFLRLGRRTVPAL